MYKQTNKYVYIGHYAVHVLPQPLHHIYVYIYINKQINKYVYI
jgi:hypothetical protein